MTTQKALGKGLSALLQNTNTESSNDNISSIAIDKISPGIYQPRKVFDQESLKDLVESIKQHGVLQPIIVRENKEKGKYEIIAGERRWRATKAAGLQEIPVIIKELENKDALQIALIENIQRDDLTPIEEAEGYKRLMEDFGYSQQELGYIIGKSRSHTSNILRLLRLPDKVKALIHSGELSMGHGRALITSTDAETLAEKIINEKLSVRESEKLSKKMSDKYVKSIPESERNPFYEVEQMLTKSFDIPTSVTLENKSKIKIAFADLKELDGFIKKIKSFKDSA